MAASPARDVTHHGGTPPPTSVRSGICIMPDRFVRRVCPQCMHVGCSSSFRHVSVSEPADMAGRFTPIPLGHAAHVPRPPCFAGSPVARDARMDVASAMPVADGLPAMPAKHPHRRERSVRLVAWHVRFRIWVCLTHGDMSRVLGRVPCVAFPSPSMPRPHPMPYAFRMRTSRRAVVHVALRDMRRVSRALPYIPSLSAYDTHPRTHVPLKSPELRTAFG